MSSNPYHAPETSSTGSDGEFFRQSRLFVVLALVGVFGGGGLVGISAIASEPIRNVIMPRFGWVGLIIGLNPIIFLGFWLHSREVGRLRAATGMCLCGGLLNSLELLRTGTVGEVSNPFFDRLFTSWFWAVLPFGVATVVLAYFAWYEPTSASASSPNPDRIVK